MARPELSDQQRQTAFQRLLGILPSASARLVMYGAAAGGNPLQTPHPASRRG